MWKYHKEMPCIGILNSQKYHFSFFFFSFRKFENRRVEQVLSGGMVPVGGVRRWGNGGG
jgi:hypothetical protein